MQKMYKMTITGISFLFALVTLSLQIERDDRNRSAMFNVMAENSRLSGDVIEARTVRFVSRCPQLCLINKACKSFNYNIETMLCEILKVNLNEVGKGRLIPASGWMYYDAVIKVINLN